jgi:hypothetical protein
MRWSGTLRIFATLAATSQNTPWQTVMIASGLWYATLGRILAARIGIALYRTSDTWMAYLVLSMRPMPGVGGWIYRTPGNRRSTEER